MAAGSSSAGGPSCEIGAIGVGERKGGERDGHASSTGSVLSNGAFYTKSTHFVILEKGSITYTQISPAMPANATPKNEPLPSHPKTNALTSILSLPFAPTPLLGSTNAVCGTLPPFSLSQHCKSNLSSSPIPLQ